MKKLLLISFLAVSASLAYAGSGCGGCDGDKKADKDKAAKPESTSVIVAGSCGGCSGDKDKKDKSATEATYQFAGSCGGCSGGDKDKKAS